MKDKTVIITGGAGEIGLATAKVFLKNGAKVLLVDLEQEKLEKAKKDMNHDQLHVFRCGLCSGRRPNDLI